MKAFSIKGERVAPERIDLKLCVISGLLGSLGLLSYRNEWRHDPSHVARFVEMPSLY